MRLPRSILPAILLGTTVGAAAQPVPLAPASSTSRAGPPANLYADPAQACARAGGHYVGDQKCSMPGGRIVPVLSGDALSHAKESETTVPYGTPRSWALATTTIMFQQEGLRPDLLAGAVATPDLIRKELGLLDHWWSIRSREDLLKTLSWLQFTGHRKEFAEVGRRVDGLNNQQFVYALDTPSLDAEGRNQLEVARRYHLRLGDTGILAWDLVRYIALCRWGYLVGFLSQDEAWKHIMPAALTLQRSFGSWKELQDDFMIGRQFWSLQQTQESGAQYQAILTQLLKDPAGPLQRNPWSMNLHVDAPLPTIGFGTDP